VLVIDDDPSVRTIIRYLLESFGYVCETAADGRSALVRFDGAAGISCSPILRCPR